MGYIDANLMKGEKIIFKTKPHWSCIVAPCILFSMGWIMFIAGIGFQAMALVIIGFLIFAIAFFWGLSELFTMISSEYALTNRRIVTKTGLISRKTMEILLNKIETVNIDQNLTGRMFNYGNLNITGTGGAQDPFKGIAAAVEFRKRIYDQIGE